MGIDYLMACYSKTRELSNFYNECLSNDNISDDEKKLIYAILLNNVKSSKKIKEYIKNIDTK
ncbi:hypothetical protein HNQ35_000086 [Cerasibacillus quisquiliarum]|uniref:Uncharacterized protein n=1 Tax=Cerasibacillus quisquiliarum TaxID=227865 RepID=A0A511UWE5_9BACI|nr:hypothetical protein [Cerasibacillus quisquiliarum]MBB5144897.1 hypothetical protein [Cerasibacillus quisquiliarum]GEN30211.1 hypothetical protein CQU01_04490 [Cerasibacillus quisquiliarum]